MRKAMMLLLSFGLLLSIFTSCRDYETYGDKKEKERKAIRQLISDSAFVVISEQQFHNQGNMTSVERREFVYLNNSGVYMQIVHKGCGKPMQDGETSDLLVRFFERCLLDTLYFENTNNPYDVDIMNVSRQGNTFTASFTSGAWVSTYGSETVPAGLLVPMSYINVGRPRSEDDYIAKVRLIVPHTQGHSLASSYVYPYYYEISFQRKTDL
ncbi:MAG: DUF4827 domain-containing protein [Prevotella sp.]|nr:DUF4827 domain-containing protein [Prevotella sp.]